MRRLESLVVGCLLAGWGRAAESLPYSGTPLSVPGVIEAEHYDRGGEGVGHHGKGDEPIPGTDFSITMPPGREPDSPTVFRQGSAEFLHLRTGEWVHYSIRCAQAGYYSVQLETLGPPVVWINVEPVYNEGTILPGKATYHLELDGADVTGPVNGLTNSVSPRIWLSEGDHVLRVQTDLVEWGTGRDQGSYSWELFGWPLDLVRIQPAEGLRRPTLVAGGDPGFADGSGPDARLGAGARFAGELEDGSLLILDPGNAAIRSMTRSGEVRTLAGFPGNPVQDGSGTNAGFGTLLDALPSPTGDIWILETQGTGSEQLRKRSPDGAVVTVYSGRPTLDVPTPTSVVEPISVIHSRTVPLTRLARSATGDIATVGPIVQRLIVELRHCGPDCGGPRPVYADIEWHVQVIFKEGQANPVTLVESPVPSDGGWLGGDYRLTGTNGLQLVYENPAGFPQETLPGVAVESALRTEDGTLFAIVGPGRLCRLDSDPDAIRLRFLVEGNGTVRMEPGVARPNDDLRLDAVPGTRWFRFDGWSDGNQDNPRILRIARDTLLTARFVEGIPDRCGIIPGSVEVTPDRQLRFRVYGDTRPFQYRVFIADTPLSKNQGTFRVPYKPGEIQVSSGAFTASQLVQTSGAETTVTVPIFGSEAYAWVIPVPFDLP